MFAEIHHAYHISEEQGCAGENTESKTKVFTQEPEVHRARIK